MAKGNEIKEKLLQKQSDSEEIVEEKKSLWKRVWEESKKMWLVAGAAIFFRFSAFGITVVNQAFIGHIGSIELAAYAVVMTLLVRFAMGLLLGMSSALGTLCGQAYGAKKYDMLGVYLQRSWIILLVAATLLLPIYIFTTPILKVLGQEENIAKVAGHISLWSIGVVYAYTISFTCQMFLQGQNKNMVVSYLAAASLVIHVILSWLLTDKLKLEVNGAMGSTVLAYWLQNLGQVLYIMYKCPETWNGFSFAAFKDLWAVIKLSLSSGVMLCLEMWYYTVLILLTGNLKGAEISLGALSICLNINGWGLTIALGFYTAASVRVSNELGRGSAKAVKFSIWITVLTSLAIGAVFFIIIIIMREKVAYIFTTDPDVVKASTDLSFLLAISMLLNTVQPVLSGVAVGAGWQGIVAYVNIGSYYFIGIPVGILFGFYFKLQVKGVWLGMLLGTLVQTIVLTIITARTDWDKEVEKTRNRVNKWSKEENPDLNSSGTSI
ncbi:putative multi antimicrobial extrusion protein [Lupinus albus]|uniref:Protein DETOXIFICATION n=1 Tax=Lupinus albus TaxID=3870 RepID=A0A6A4NLJ5_LUPAL|nr:putative multi antimicrobial extrusion protein [Lupinus albus]